jgi:peptidyl-tRNA hydrolase
MSWLPPVVDKSVVLYHYVVVRSDLPLGTVCAQIVHAAGESSPGNLPPHTHAVVLSVTNEDALLELEARLLAADVECYPIREPDAPWNGALMAIGLPPQRKQQLVEYLGHYSLLNSLSV